MRVIDLFERERNAAIVDEATGVKIWKKDAPRVSIEMPILNRYELMLFRPKAIKPFAHYVFPTSEKRRRT
jgi:hypothetical protein